MSYREIHKQNCAIHKAAYRVCSCVPEIEPAPSYEITSERFTNDEGSDFVDLTITFASGEVIRESFASFFDSPSEPAVVQAASFVAAFEESQQYSIEERLGPYGIEWEREQEERCGW